MCLTNLAQVCPPESQSVLPTQPRCVLPNPSQPGLVCFTDPARVCPIESQSAWPGVSYRLSSGVSYRIPVSLARCVFPAQQGCDLPNPCQPGQACLTGPAWFLPNSSQPWGNIYPSCVCHTKSQSVCLTDPAQVCHTESQLA